MSIPDDDTPTPHQNQYSIPPQSTTPRSAGGEHRSTESTRKSTDHRWTNVDYDEIMKTPSLGGGVTTDAVRRSTRDWKRRMFYTPRSHYLSVYYRCTILAVTDTKHFPKRSSPLRSWFPRRTSVHSAHHRQHNQERHPTNMRAASTNFTLGNDNSTARAPRVNKQRCTSRIWRMTRRT